MDLFAEIATARKSQGLSQQALGAKVGTDRTRIARLESGVASTSMLVKVLATLGLRLSGVAMGANIVEQLSNARAKRRWTLEELASRAGLDRRTVAAVEAGRGTAASVATMLRVLAPKASVQDAPRVHWHYNKAKDAQRDCRFTPPVLLDALVEAFGPICLDPCNHSDAPIEAGRKIALPDDGLAADWSGGFVYVNPPFSDLAPWLSKAMDAFDAGQVGKLVFLLPASRLDIRPFSQRAALQATTLILKKRYTFISPNPKYCHPAPFALALVCLGCPREEILRFGSLIPCVAMLPQHGLECVVGSRAMSRAALGGRERTAVDRTSTDNIDTDRARARHHSRTLA